MRRCKQNPSTLVGLSDYQSKRHSPARAAGRSQAVVRTEQAGAGGDGEANVFLLS